MTQPPTDADLAALLDAERGSEAARARSTQRWIRQQAEEEARLSGVLLSAAEQRETITVRTTSARSHTGTVAGVGVDYAAVASAGGVLVYIALAAITVVQSDRALAPVPAGDARTGPTAATLHDVLSQHAGERPDVVFVCAGQPDSVPGRLIAVGVDVASVVVDERRRIAYVALSSVTEVSLRASG